MHCIKLRVRTGPPLVQEHTLSGPHKSSFPRACATHSATATSTFHQNEALNVMSRNQEGVCFSRIRALQGAMLAAKNFYQDNDNLGNM